MCGIAVSWFLSSRLWNVSNVFSEIFYTDDNDDDEENEKWRYLFCICHAGENDRSIVLPHLANPSIPHRQINF